MTITLTGYSDRINHALAFAAKHHDQQVRQGTKLPYRTNPANVAIILTRYDQDEDTIVAGILHDVVQDCVREGYTREKLQQRIAEKFGDVVLDTLLSVTERPLDEDGVEMSADERRDDLLRRLGSATPRGLWVAVADKIHAVGALVADLQRTRFPETIWSRFHAGRDGTVGWYQRVEHRLNDIGFRAPALLEFRSLVDALARVAAAPAAGARAG